MSAHGGDSDATSLRASAFPQEANGAASDLVIAAGTGLPGLHQRAILSRLPPGARLWAVEVARSTWTVYRLPPGARLRRPRIALKSLVFYASDPR
jgi:hypothetical protein